MTIVDAFEHNMNEYLIRGYLFSRSMREDFFLLSSSLELDRLIGSIDGCLFRKDHSYSAAIEALGYEIQRVDDWCVSASGSRMVIHLRRYGPNAFQHACNDPVIRKLVRYSETGKPIRGFNVAMAETKLGDYIYTRSLIEDFIQDFPDAAPIIGNGGHEPVTLRDQLKGVKGLHGYLLEVLVGGGDYSVERIVSDMYDYVENKKRQESAPDRREKKKIGEIRDEFSRSMFLTDQVSLGLRFIGECIPYYVRLNPDHQRCIDAVLGHNDGSMGRLVSCWFDYVDQHPLIDSETSKIADLVESIQQSDRKELLAYLASGPEWLDLYSILGDSVRKKSMAQFLLRFSDYDTIMDQTLIGQASGICQDATKLGALGLILNNEGLVPNSDYLFWLLNIVQSSSCPERSMNLFFNSLRRGDEHKVYAVLCPGVGDKRDKVRFLERISDSDLDWIYDEKPNDIAKILDGMMAEKGTFNARYNLMRQELASTGTSREFLSRLDGAYAKLQTLSLEDSLTRLGRSSPELLPAFVDDIDRYYCSAGFRLTLSDRSFFSGYEGILVSGDEEKRLLFQIAIESPSTNPHRDLSQIFYPVSSVQDSGAVSPLLRSHPTSIEGYSRIIIYSQRGFSIDKQKDIVNLSDGIIDVSFVQANRDLPDVRDRDYVICLTCGLEHGEYYNIRHSVNSSRVRGNRVGFYHLPSPGFTQLRALIDGMLH